jgi:hypothetical protein
MNRTTYTFTSSVNVPVDLWWEEIKKKNNERWIAL